MSAKVAFGRCTVLSGGFVSLSARFGTSRQCCCARRVMHMSAADLVRHILLPAALPES